MECSLSFFSLSFFAVLFYFANGSVLQKTRREEGGATFDGPITDSHQERKPTTSKAT